MNTTDILRRLEKKEITVEEAEQLLQNGEEKQELEYANIDYEREERTGVPEVIYCAGKTAGQVRGIVQNMREHGQKHILGTRCSREKYEAAREVCRQLRLRNISGIVIVDFINMEEPEHLKALMDILREEAARDSIQTTVVDRTSLHLIEMTRKKVHRSLAEQVRL